MLRGHVDEGIAHCLAHCQRAADVNVAARGEQAPDQRTLLPDPVLDVLTLAGLFARCRDLHVIEHPSAVNRSISSR